MQRLSTGTRKATDGSGKTHRTITINPMADATPEQFEHQLDGSTVLKSGYLIAIEANGATVTVVLTSFTRTKRALQQAGQLPRFCYLLPDED